MVNQRQHIPITQSRDIISIDKLSKITIMIDLKLIINDNNFHLFLNVFKTGKQTCSVYTMYMPLFVIHITFFITTI